jgi:dihydroxy-acid dehydratase
MAGGVPAVMKRLEDDLHGDALSVTGRTIGDIASEGRVLDETVIPDKTRPHMQEGGTVILYGNLAPDGSVVKQSAVVPDMHVFTGIARVFESEADCLKALHERTIREGEAVLIRNEGPRGGPGMPETLMVTIMMKLLKYQRVALITDGRFSGYSSGPCIGHVSPEASVGGPIAAVRDGDKITIDIPGRRIEVNLTDEEIKKRLKDWKPVSKDIPPGFMRRYVKYVSSAANGAILE